MNVTAQKIELRKLLRAEAAKHSEAERATASAAICERIQSHPSWQTAHAILFYAPMPGEPDIEPLAHAALSAGKTVALPRYDGAAYHACVLADFAQLQPGQYGIREPHVSCPIVALNRLDFLLIPGVAFSLSGRRLGRGKGHYDRLLAEARGQKCGVAFDWQLTVEVPTERHDILLDYIVTPTRWHVVAGGANGAAPPSARVR